MDYLHYRFKNWKPFEYMNLPEGQKRIARAYMRQELRDKEERNKEIEKARKIYQFFEFSELRG